MRYVDISKEFNARLMIDDAHGVGILGVNGGGTPQHFDCACKIDVLMGSMDKAFGGIGGYLCGSRETIKYLRVAARSSILSSSLPAGIAGAMIQSAKLIQRYESEREALFQKAKYLKTSLQEAGFTILGNADLPAIPLLIGDEQVALKFNDLLWDEGIFCNVFRWPAVSLQKARLRIVVMLGHSKSHPIVLSMPAFEQAS
jgi:7-keto-8-aminopelargonate synthetase-like enzyme